MNSIPSIAVVIPVFNKRSSILRTLQCIMAQTTPVTEIVVVDDCSTDGSVEVVESSQIDRLRIIKNASQLGPGAARDVGWRSCQSDYIAFLDADDEWDPRFIEVALDLASRFPQAGACTTGYRVVSRGGFFLDVVNRVEENEPTLVQNYFERSCTSQLLWTSCTILPRHVLQAVNGWPAMRWGEDLLLWAHIAVKYPVACSPEILATYRLDGPNRDSDKYGTSAVGSIMDFLNQSISNGSILPAQWPHVRRYIAKVGFAVARQMVLQGEGSAARGILAKCPGREGNIRLWWILSWFASPITRPLIKTVVRRYRRR